MPQINYRASKFKGSLAGVNTAGGSLTVTWDDVVWASISVGKLGLTDLFAHGAFSTSEMLFRAHMIYANLMQTPAGGFNRSPLYDSLDSTEKGAVSYFLGMAMAKLFGARLFGVPWLVHLEKLQRYRTVTFAPGKSRPDLIGASAGRWVVVEAKGRTRVFNQGALDKAKKQTRKVRQISGSPPWVRVATECFFDQNLQVCLVDPPEYDDDAVDVEIEEPAYLRVYYEPFLKLLDARDMRKVPMGQQTCLCAYDHESGVTIGLLDRVFGLLRDDQGSFRSIEHAVGQTGGAAPVDGMTYRVFPDGLVVGLDRRWSEESMQMAPEERK